MPRANVKRACQILISAVALLVAAAAPVQATTYWMAPGDPWDRGPLRPDLAGDFDNLFKHGSEWTKAAKRVKVLKVGPNLIDYAPIDVLKRLFDALRNRGIALGWEMEAIPPKPTCGRGVEGYSGDIARSVARIMAAGGTVGYVSMDEPFWYGHYAEVSNSCHYSIPDLARGVASGVEIVRRAFPHVKVGDIEPVGVPHTNNYPAQVAAWSIEFHKATGHHLAFFHSDIDWNGSWHHQTRIVRREFSGLGIPFGIIINGDAGAKTDRAWTEDALAHLRQVVDLERLRPQTLIFQTWNDRPARILPESRLGSFTNFVTRATRPAAKVTVIPDVDMIRGTVTDSSGQPIKGATVRVTVRDALGLYGLQALLHTGVVPQRAVKALFGLRVGVECNCAGNVDITVGQMVFGESNGLRAVRFLDPAGRAYSLHVKAGYKALINTPVFRVRPNERYTADVALRVREQAGYPGYLALIFLNKAGREIHRDEMELAPASIPLVPTRTRSNGGFSVILPAHMDADKLVISVLVGRSRKSRATAAEVDPIPDK